MNTFWETSVFRYAGFLPLVERAESVTLPAGKSAHEAEKRIRNGKQSPDA